MNLLTTRGKQVTLIPEVDDDKVDDRLLGFGTSGNEP